MVQATAPQPLVAEAQDAPEIPVREVGEQKVPYDVLKTISQESAEHYRLVPIGIVEGVLEVGMVDPENIEGIDALNFIARKSGMPFKIHRVSEDSFNKVLTMYRGLGGEMDRAVSDLETEQRSDVRPKEKDTGAIEQLNLGSAPWAPPASEKEGLAIQEDAPTIKIASTILRYAIDGHASDIHIEPTNSGVKVRYRVDGELHTSVILPLTTHRALVARIKVLSSIRLDEQRKPQDGRFSATIADRTVDFRVSTFPSSNGEKVVIRILDREQNFISLDKIGLTDRSLAILREAIRRPHGLILISGPTGSGKSTTLYSMLAELDREHKNVLSLEDPIEYFIDGVTQSQVRPEIGYTFANGLRTTLRQDPDIIMVGEIRDGETAKLAFQAALTGHLVFSTIHTNDSVGTVSRLIDMGVEPYLIPPVLILSIAQRLVRTLCPGTGKEVPMSPSIRKGIDDQMATLAPDHRFPIPDVVMAPERSQGCLTGLRGRMAVFEIMSMSSAIERVILDNPVESRIWKAARSEGVITMREDAMMKSFAKLIPFSEVETLSSLLLDTEESVRTDAPEVPKTEASETNSPAKKQSGLSDDL